MVIYVQKSGRIEPNKTDDTVVTVLIENNALTTTVHEEPLTEEIKRLVKFVQLNAKVRNVYSKQENN